MLTIGHGGILKFQYLFVLIINCTTVLVALHICPLNYFPSFIYGVTSIFMLQQNMESASVGGWFFYVHFLTLLNNTAFVFVFISIILYI